MLVNILPWLSGEIRSSAANKDKDTVSDGKETSSEENHDDEEIKQKLERRNAEKKRQVRNKKAQRRKLSPLSDCQMKVKRPEKLTWSNGSKLLGRRRLKMKKYEKRSFLVQQILKSTMRASEGRKLLRQDLKRGKKRPIIVFGPICGSMPPHWAFCIGHVNNVKGIRLLHLLLLRLLRLIKM
jgi:hypothetical protein